MSHYPSTPSYAGSANYTPQWPAYPPHPSSDVPDPAISGANTCWGAKTFAPMPFNAIPPTQLPGLGLANGFTPSPYLPQNHPNSQIPVPFGAHLNGTGAYSQDASHFTSPSMPQQSPRTLQPLTSHPASGSHENAHAPTHNDTDREEGEVSDFSGNDTASQNAQHHVRSKLSSRSHANERSLPRPSIHRDISPTDLSAVPTLHSQEPTEMSVSDNSRPQREGSESPYNPPMTITAIPEVSEEIASMQSKGHLQEGSSVRAHVGTSLLAGKTVAQARVMAQGALLGLVPHNIRYHELVKENIDPDILRQLYNEIGIKVVPDVKSSEKNSVTESGVLPKDMAGGARGQEITTTTHQRSDQSTIPQQKDEKSSAKSSSKPLERKELIAQMLAAKANKATNNTELKSDDSTSQPASSRDNSMTSPKASSATAPKAKNKAQTELARQRMEQLLKKRQQSQPTKSPTLKTPSTDNTQQPTTLSHPLPERPPVPDKQNVVATVQAPQKSGPSSNVSESKSSSMYADTESSEIDLSTPGRAAVKRPRASDFDDFVSKSLKPSVSQDRLVIDISDDESMGDDDDARPPNADNATASQMSNLARLNGLSYQRSSASATPQGRISDPESLRRKQLEIEAMRRRIAEYEEKQKAKKQTVGASSSASSSSVPSISGQDDATQSHPEEPLASAATTLTKPVSAGVSISSSARLSVATDASISDQLRQKLRRRHEIESGLPTLNNELERIEAKLAGFRRLEEDLMAEMAKGREGRKQLLEELQTLILETQDIEVSQESQSAPVAEVVPTLQDGARLENTTTIPGHSTNTIEPPLSNQAQAIKLGSPCVTPTSSEAGDDNVMVESYSSSSGGSGSSMSESTSGSEQGSIAPEIEPEQQVLQSRPDNDYAPGQHSSAKESSVIERPVSLDSSVVAISKGPKASDGPAAVPDNEKPSEVKDSEDEVYSPKLDASDNDEEMDTDSTSSSSSHEADVELTPKVQEQVVIASKNDALDNGTSRATTTMKFSPYESPLKIFRGYRYHPNFVDEVGDGYRSLTYSHKINPSQAVCPYESAGGVCNDNTCEFQHWRDMVMPDDKILVEMGNQREGSTAEEKERFLEGLKETINTMQRDEVKDFTTVASEIAAYRRRFLSDPSRILPL